MQQPVVQQPVVQQPVVQQPVVQQLQTQHTDPYAQSANPYGLPAVERPYVPMQGMNAARTGAQQYGNQAYGNQAYGYQNYGNRPEQTVGVGFAISGLVFFALSLVGLIPGSPIYFLSYGAIFAVIGGIRLLSRRGKGAPIKLWPALVALIFGLIAILISGSEFALNQLAASHVSSAGSLTTTQNGATNGGTTSNTGAQGGSSSGVVPTPPTFASDPSLTAYEKTAASVALEVDTFANGGMAYSPIAKWPDALTLGNDGSIILPSGTSGASLPAGQAFKYEVSKDKKNFAVFVSGGNKTEIAIYDSETNSFKWICENGAASTCPAGGLPADSGSDTTTSNS